MEKRPFTELGLSDASLKAVAKLGFEEASPIQTAAIPVLLGGSDFVGQSQTGSGKTAAFVIPALERLDFSQREPQVLILSPTRELALQVADEVHRLAAFMPKVHAVPIFGGSSYDRQFYELKRHPQIVIGTPGRLMDHMDRKTLDLSKLRLVVLDECDRMLDMGFRDDIEKILASSPAGRQTVFFSATLPAVIRDLIGRYSKDAIHIRISPKEVTVPTVEQVYYEVPPRYKTDALMRIIDLQEIRLGIIFCNTQRMVDELTDTLQGRGYSADRLHGGLSQPVRTRTIEKFRRSGFDLLIATDVAGRGLDVEGVDLVVNFDLPWDPEDYVHRIGRTGRAGRKGLAMTIVSGREIYKLQGIERFTRSKLGRGTVPTVDEVEQKRAGEVLQRVRERLQSGRFKPQDGAVDQLLSEGHSSTDVASAMFHELLTASGFDPDQARAAPAEAPPPESRSRSRESASPRAARESAGSSDAPKSAADREGAPRDLVPLPAPARGFQWIRVNVGRNQNLGPREIVDLFTTGALNFPPQAVGQIKLMDDQSFVQIHSSHSRSLVDDMEGAELDGRELKVAFAVRSPSASGSRERRPAGSTPPWKRRPSGPPR